MAKNITKAKHRFPLRELRHLGKLVRNLWPVFVLILVTGLLIFLNYEPGTYLIGWDNLNPEFDIAENIRRSLFSVWQEYRGPGLLGGMAHAADLPRVLFVWLLLAFKIDPSFVRYITSFLPLVLGPLGIYFLFYNHLFKGKLDSRTIQFASFLGALYYLLNLNTLQTFFVPFETFTWFYGALPWLLFFIITYLTHPSKKNLLVLFLISFLSAPAFYVETIFVVFFVALLPFLIEFLRQQKHKVAHLKTTILSLFSLIIPHLFWLLPVAFFVITNGHIPEEARNNLLSSPETYARNLQFATLKDTALMKGYLFNYLDLGQDNKYTYLLSVWRSHLDISIINLIGFLSFILVLTGLYYSFKKKFSWTHSFVALLGLCLFFLLGGGLLINNQIPLVGELFRSPFTKFSIPLSLAYSFFFAIGTIFLLDLFTFLHSRLTYYLTLFTVAFSLIIFMSPAFSGNLISPAMRTQIPSEYFELFSYMRTQNPSERIGNFPQFSHWGWGSYDWGYRGSGFLWYGLRQPLMDRAFDAWDKNSERYYEEMSLALYGENQNDFEYVLDKYNISWLLIDEYITLPENATDSGLLTLKKFVTSSSKYSTDKKFGDQISLYKVSHKDKIENFLSVQNPLNTIRPFDSLSLRPNTDWTRKGGFLSITQNTTGKEGDTLILPSLTDTETLLPVRIEYRKIGNNLDLRLTPLIPTIFLDNNQIDLSVTPLTLSIPSSSGTGFILQLDKDYFELQLPAELDNFTDFYPLTTTYLPTQKAFTVSLYNSSETGLYDLTDKLSQTDPSQCYVIKPNHKVEKLSTPTGVTLIGTDVVGCLSSPLPYTPQGNLLSLSFTYSSPTLTPGSANISGKDLNAINLPQPLEPQEKSTRARLFAPSTGSFQMVNLILEASETKSVREINYDNIEVAVLPQIYSSTAKLPSIPAKNIVLKNTVTTIQVSLPQTNTQYDQTETPLENSLLPENLNCDQWNDGNTVKQVTKDGFLYQSQNATECDSLNLRHLPHSINYLLSFDYRFQKGLATTICLENHSSRRCDIKERLIKTNNTQSIIQPQINQSESPGYTLHIENQSFGSRITSNLIKSISIRPLPLQFIQNIQITSQNLPQSTATITSSTHPYIFLYTAAVKNNDSAVLNLYQTKSSSWKAIQVSSKDLSLPPWLITILAPVVSPFLPQLAHTDTNLWHNAWVLPKGSSNIILIYLPQYLEFAGFILLFLSPLIYLIVHLLNNRYQTKDK
ncbi:MAG TPA: hypothetical protein VLH94_04280 [Spirochaetia bacterium]|nr:hypothetical protein [Spirochaetia bacterium]